MDVMLSLCFRPALRARSMVACLGKNRVSAVSPRWLIRQASSKGDPTRSSRGDSHSSHARWTSEELAKLRSLKESGLAWQEINPMFPDRSLHSIKRQWTRQLALAGKSHPYQSWTAEEEEKLRTMKKAGLGWARIRNELTCRSMNALKSHWRDLCFDDCRQDDLKASPPRAWTQAELSELLDLRRAGTSWPDVASRLQRRETACSVQFYHARASEGKHDLEFKRWTPAEDEVLKTMVRQGLKRRDIGVTLGRTKDSISSRLKSVRGMNPSDGTFRRKKWLWSPEEVERLAKGIQQGVPHAQIALALERTTSSVTNKLLILRRRGGLEKAESDEASQN